MLKVHKMTKKELMQKLFRQFEEEHDHGPAGTRPVVEWAVRKGWLAKPQIDPMDVLAGQMADALRAETAVDEQGRTYRLNHAVRITKNGQQMTFWAIMGFAPREHMEMSFTQRREQVIGDCFQLKVDVDVYNEQNPDVRPVPLELNFSEDVAERMVLREDEREPAGV